MRDLLRCCFCKSTLPLDQEEAIFLHPRVAAPRATHCCFASAKRILPTGSRALWAVVPIVSLFELLTDSLPVTAAITFDDGYVENYR